VLLAPERPGARGRRGAADKRILIGNPLPPGLSEVPIYFDFESIRLLTSGLHDPSRIIGIRRSRVRAVQPINRRREREVMIHVPLDAKFIVSKFFWFDLLRDYSQRRELISRTR
jgi:hypothetical protein